MRTINRGLALAAALAALGACHNASEPQTAHDPIGGTPRAQQPISHPEPQKPVDPVANLIGEDDVYGPQKPANNPTPQEPQFADPEPQRPIQDVIAGRNTKQSTLSDGDVLAVARALNQSEIDAAEVAKKNAKSAGVKQFASMLVTQHRDAKAKEQRVEQKAKVDVKDTAMSKQVKEESRSELDALKGKKGKNFDAAFLDAQIKAHQSALHTIDDSLVPAAQNPEVKNHLTQLRRTVEEHLSQAESIRANLDENATSTTTTTSGKVKAKAKSGENKVFHETDTSKGNRPEDVKKDDTNKK